MPLDVDHIAIAVSSMDEALGTFERLYGLKADHAEEIASDKVAEAIQCGFQSGRDGITTRELAADVERAMGERGLSFLWAFTNAGPGYVRAPSEMTISGLRRKRK